MISLKKRPNGPPAKTLRSKKNTPKPLPEPPVQSQRLVSHDSETRQTELVG